MTNQIMTEKPQAGCFPADTLVHTKEGLRPIEEIKVGDFVLSKPESGVGDLAYKRVTKTFVRENSEVFGVTYGIKGKGVLIVTTAEHPFWVPTLRVSDPNVQFGGINIPHGKWITPEEMFKTKDNYYKNKGENAGYYLSTYDGKEYPANATPICTANQKPKRNRVCDFSGPEFGALWPVDQGTQREAMGEGVDFRVSPPALLTLPPPHTNIMSTADIDKNSRNTDKASWIAGTTEYFTRGYQPKLCTVYNLEVEDYHTYFVGEHGIWVRVYAH
jgi:Pretoxin HINT domain